MICVGGKWKYVCKLMVSSTKLTISCFDEQLDHLCIMLQNLCAFLNPDQHPQYFRWQWPGASL
jgi:hypothetical protein